MVFPVVMYGCESWTIKKAESQRINAFELWCWRRLLRVPWTARRSNLSILKEISPSNEHPGLISFRMDWLDLIAVHGTSQESSPTSQFKNINSSALNLLYGPTLMSIYEYWTNHRFDCMDFCRQSNVSAFLKCCQGWS